MIFLYSVGWLEVWVICIVGDCVCVREKRNFSRVVFYLLELIKKIV